MTTNKTGRITGTEMEEAISRFGCLLLQAYCRHGRQAGGHVK